MLNPDQSSVSVEKEPSLREGPPPKRKNHWQRWVYILLALLLLAGTGYGVRWWLGRSNASQSQGRGGPMGVPVKLSTLETSILEESSEFVGALKAPRSANIRPEIEGRVARILVTEGDRVPAGRPLVLLSPEKRQAEFASVLQGVNVARASRANAFSQLQALEAERVSQQAEVELQQENYRRTATLVGQGALARAELDRVTRDRRAALANLNATNKRIEASQANLAEATAGLRQAEANAAVSQAELQDTLMRAPFAGVVGAIPVKVGDFVNKGDTLTSVTQNQVLEIEMAIPLERAPGLRLGQSVTGTDAQGKLLGTGQISFISPQVNSQSQTIQAKASFENTAGQLRDGQFIRARVLWGQRPGVLVPATAISRLAGEPFIFTAQAGPDNKLVAKQNPVKLGAIQGNNYQVIDGVKSGDRIIVSGIQNLTEGAPILVDSAPEQKSEK